MTPVLALDNVAKRYPDGARAVNGVTFSAAEGELVVLVGPSGCGKSTLLRIVAGLETASGGTVQLRGEVVNGVDPADRNIAMVFQNYALYPHMSVRGNMAYGLKNRKVPKPEIERRVGEAAALLQIEALLDRKPSQLSGGQRQRVAMGRAIVRHPALFLFDEPLSNLDAMLRTQMRLEIKHLQRRLGVAMLYVTHDQVEAMTLADKIVVLNQGEVEQIAAPGEIYRHPASTFVARFIGTPPMNLFEARIEDGLLRLGGMAFPAPDIAPDIAGATVTVGIRPESPRICPAGQGIPLRVSTVENLGPTRLVHGSIEDTPFTLSADTALDLRADPVEIQVAPGDIHYFHPVSGVRL